MRNGDEIGSNLKVSSKTKHMKKSCKYVQKCELGTKSDQISSTRGGPVWGPGKGDGGRQPGKSSFDKEV